MSRKKMIHLTDHQKREAKAIRECLDYLEGAAVDAGLILCAHLIGLAAEATDGRVQTSREEIENLGRNDSQAVRANGGGHDNAQHHKATVN